MRIARRFAVAVAVMSVCLTTAVVHAGTFTQTIDPAAVNTVVVTYDPDNGNLSFAGNDELVTTIEITSASNMFIPANVNDEAIGALFPIMNEGKFFRVETDGLASLNIGNILPAGLTAQALIDDLGVNGSLWPQGYLIDAAGGGPYLYLVPEPSSLVLAIFGLLGLLRLRRK